MRRTSGASGRVRRLNADLDFVHELGRGPAIEVWPTVAQWYVERSGHDYSIEDSFNLTVPAPALMRGLDLRLAEGAALDYSRPDGLVLFRDPSACVPGFSAAVVDRATFEAFLNREDLDVVWLMSGEKSAHGGPSNGNGWGGMLEYWGLFRLQGGSIVGPLAFVEKRPRPEQLKVMLAHP